MKKEAAAFREIRKGLGVEDGAKRTFEKVGSDRVGFSRFSLLFLIPCTFDRYSGTIFVDYSRWKICGKFRGGSNRFLWTTS